MMQVLRIKPFHTAWRSLAIVSLATWAAHYAGAQPNQRTLLSPPLPESYQQAPREFEEGVIRSAAGPTFEYSDSPVETPVTSEQPLPSMPSLPPLEISTDSTPLVGMQQVNDPSGSAPPVMGSLTDYLRRQGEEEIRQLRSLRSGLGQLNKIIGHQKRREEEALSAAAEAKRRERLALETTREAERQRQEVELEKQEMRRLSRELERREQDIKRRQKEREMADRQRVETPTPSATPRQAPRPIDIPTPAQTTTDPTLDADSPIFPATEAVPAAVAITSGAVDQRALADNLFGAAEYKLAANIYQQLLGQSSEPREAMWFRFQTANCYRHIGNQELAASYYREVVSDPLDPFLADTAKWWLSTLERRHGMQQRTVELAVIMDQISNTIDEQL